MIVVTWPWNMRMRRKDSINLAEAEIRLSKLHLSSALRAEPSTKNLQLLHSFVEEVYLHQVVVGKEGKNFTNGIRTWILPWQMQILETRNWEMNGEFIFMFHYILLPDRPLA